MADTRVDQEALGIFYANASDLDKLKKSYAEMQGTIASKALSMQLKNTDFDGEATPSGTVTVRRMKTSVVRAYGTARAATEGDSLQNNGVDVKIDQNKEIVEEIETKDIKKYGLGNLIQKRSANHGLAMAVHLDVVYFDKLQTSGSVVDVSSVSDVQDKLLMLIRELEDVTNENVEKVDRENMVMTLAPEWYDEMKKYMHTLPNPDGQDTRTFHNVEVHSSPRQTLDAIIQVKGSVAQPVTMSPYAPSKIPLSDAVGVALFAYYGTKAIMSDLIFVAALDENISA